jgi:hypothetical protein
VSKKKLVLKDYERASIFAVGVAGTATEFQLSHSLNQLLNVQLSATNPTLKQLKSQTISFPRFIYDNEDQLQVVLLKNKIGSTVLFSGQQIFDYILIFAGEDSAPLKELTLRELKTSDQITLTSQIETSSLSGLKSYLP